MIAFIEDHKNARGAEPICKVLPIAASTHRDYAAKRADPAKLSLRARKDIALQPESARIFAAHHEV